MTRWRTGCVRVYVYDPQVINAGRFEDDPEAARGGGGDVERRDAEPRLAAGQRDRPAAAPVRPEAVSGVHLHENALL